MKQIGEIEEFVALLASLAPIALEMLAEEGAFQPYGGAVSTEGEFAPVESNYDLEPGEIIQDLKERFVAGARAGDLVATALFYDSRVTDPADGTKSDAIAISMDHRDGTSIMVAIPYKIADGKITKGNLILQSGAGDIFPSAAAQTA